MNRVAGAASSGGPHHPVLLLALCLPGLNCGQSPEPVMPAQQQAFALVSQQFRDAFPDRPLVEPDVRWWTDKCPGSDRTAVLFGTQCYSGLYYRGDGVDVAWRGTIGTSAYSHELMHYFLDQAYGDSDPLHQRLDAWELVLHADTQLQHDGM